MPFPFQYCFYKRFWYQLLIFSKMLLNFQSSKFHFFTENRYVTLINYHLYQTTIVNFLFLRTCIKHAMELILRLNAVYCLKKALRIHFIWVQTIVNDTR